MIHQFWIIHEGEDLLSKALSLSYLNDTFVNAESNLSYIQTKFNVLDKLINDIKDENRHFKNEIKELKYELDESWEATETLERELSFLSQHNRRENIEITGIPDNIDNHSLEITVIDILRKIGVHNLNHWEIAACHRLKKRKGDKFTNVIVKFVNRKRAIQCFRNRKNFKDIRDFPNCYIFENLCPRFRSIFDECTDLKNSGEIKKLWTFNGIINFKKTDNLNERPKKLFHINDLNNYFPDT